jgi:hypothetical protein
MTSQTNISRHAGARGCTPATAPGAMRRGPLERRGANRHRRHGSCAVSQPSVRAEQAPIATPSPRPAPIPRRRAAKGGRVVRRRGRKADGPVPAPGDHAQEPVPAPSPSRVDHAPRQPGAGGPGAAAVEKTGGTLLASPWPAGPCPGGPRRGRGRPGSARGPGAARRAPLALGRRAWGAGPSHGPAGAASRPGTGARAGAACGASGRSKRAPPTSASKASRRVMPRGCGRRAFPSWPPWPPQGTRAGRRAPGPPPRAHTHRAGSPWPGRGRGPLVPAQCGPPRNPREGVWRSWQAQRGPAAVVLISNSSPGARVVQGVAHAASHVAGSALDLH